MKKIYFIEEKRERFYVYYLGDCGPMKTLFDVSKTREDAEKAIAEHRQGEHATQWEPSK